VNVEISFVVDINRIGTGWKRDGIRQHKASRVCFEPRMDLDEPGVDFSGEHYFGDAQIGLAQPLRERAEYVIQKQQPFSRRNPFCTPEFCPGPTWER